MAGRVGQFVTRKHFQHDVNENDVPAAQPDLVQRQAAAKLKFHVRGSALGGQSTSGSGIPARDIVTGPFKVRQSVAAQDKYQNNGQGQGQAFDQADSSHLWADSTLGSDSLDTERGHDYELADTPEQRVTEYDDGAESLEEQSESDPEEDEDDRNSVQYQQSAYNDNARQSGFNNVNIPMRGGHTRRFEPQTQYLQPNAPISRAAGGVQQNYNQSQVPGYPGYQVQMDNMQQQNIDTFAASEIDEDTIHSSVSNSARGNGRRANMASSKRSAADISELDFEPDTLFKMPYKQLKEQPFDEDPKLVQSPLTSASKDTLKPLDERMEWYKIQPKDDQEKFLAALSIDEWEQAGEWIMKQFGNVMTKVADARRERRKIAAEIEDKLAARDAEVKKETESVAAALQQLKHGGQDLLRGRTPT